MGQIELKWHVILAQSNEMRNSSKTLYTPGNIAYD